MKFYCSICYAELEEVSKRAICTYCGHEEEAEWICPQGHYCCEECRLSSQEVMIERICNFYQGTNPIEIANLIMKHPSFHSCGPEHHILVAPVIVTSLINDKAINLQKNVIQAAIKRTQDIPFAVCASRGDCGAAVGAGCAISLITKANYKSDLPRSMTLEVTALALLKLAKLGGARCCKQSIYATIESTYGYLSKIRLPDVLNKSIIPVNSIHCQFKDKITDCKKEKCPYFQ